MYERLVEHLKKVRPATVCVEAGHIYANEDPSIQHTFGAAIGADICEELEKQGIPTARMLFVDDFNVNPEEVSLDIQGYLRKLSNVGFTPDILKMESSLCIPAKELLERLNGRTKVENGIVCLEKPVVHLCKEGRPLCNLLDAALYTSKFEQFGFSVTVLPSDWENQQSSVRKVLKALGYQPPPMANVYFNSNGGTSGIKIRIPQ